MSQLEQIVVTGCPECGALARAIAEGDCVRYRHIDTATLKAAQGGVTEAMVERAAAAIKDIANPRFVGEVACVGFAEAALEAALSAEPAAPCSLNEAMEVIEVWADHGGQVHGEAAARLRALADRIAPEPAAQGEAVAWQYRRLDEEEGPSPYWHHMTREQYEMFRDNPRSNCEVRQLFTAPPAQPAERVPEGLQSALREAAEVLQMVADSGVKLPPNWRWPLLDELSGYAYMLTMDSPAPSEGGKGVDDDPPTCPICDQMKLSARCSACGYEEPTTGAAR